MRVLIVGLGSIAKKHIKALRNIDEKVELYALKREVQEEKNSIKHIYSFEDIQKIDLDFIIVSNPTNVHYSTLEKTSTYNTPLFIEKPVFNNVGEEERKLVDKLSNTTLTYVACNLRFHKGLIKMKQLLQGKKIEEVNVYCGSYLPNWRPNVDFRQVYSANKEQGGGVHIDLIHELDYMYWIFGEPESTQSIFSNKSSLSISAYDYANYIWSYPDFNASIILNYYRKDTKRTFEVLTTEGSYLLDLVENKIYFEKEEIYSEQQEIMEMYEAQMRFFINDILKKEKNFNPIDEGYKILELCI